MGVFAAGRFAERGPGFDRDLAIGLRRQHQDHLGGVDIGDDLGEALVGAVEMHAVQRLEMFDLMAGLPGHALDAIADRVHQRAERGEAGL